MRGEETLGSEGMENNSTELTMADLLDQSLDLQPIERGSIIRGTIVSIAPSEILVNIGSKYEGVVRPRDLDRVDDAVIDQLKVGDKVPVYVLQLEDEEGYVELSLNKALIEQDWERAQEVYKTGETFEGEVVSTNKGGLIVNFGAVRGFVPGSQLTGEHTTRSDKANQWANLIGQELVLKIIEVDRRRNRLILSERLAVEEHRRRQKELLLQELKEGNVRQGRVSSLADFGAFVDLGGAEGLVHLSELAWVQVSHPREVLKVGDKVEVYILSIDHERQRVGLSLKRLQAEPWAEAVDHYQLDQIVPAVITKLTNFGAFARIDNAIEGLIHISELSDRPIGHPREVVSEGDKVEVCIISIEPEKRRMGLSLKHAIQPEIEWVDADEADESTSLEEADDEADDEALSPTNQAEAGGEAAHEANVAADSTKEPDPEAVVA